MKNKILIVLMLLATFCFAEEMVLLNVDKFSSTQIEEYSFEKWEVVPQSSLKTTTQLKMTNYGLGVLVNLPEGQRDYVSYKVIPPYSTSLNEANSELGYIENVGEIKKIQMTAVGINKDDEVTIYLSRSLTDKVGKPYKMGSMQFIGESILIWDNPHYIDDPVKRTKTPGPVYGDEASNLFVRAIEVRTKCDYPVSVVYFKNISIIYDLDQTEEEQEIIKGNEEIWGVNNALKDKIKENELKKLKLKKEKVQYNSDLMHQEEEER